MAHRRLVAGLCERSGRVVGAPEMNVVVATESGGDVVGVLERVEFDFRPRLVDAWASLRHVGVNGPVSGSPAGLVPGEPMRGVGQPCVEDSAGDVPVM
jgi:hypothetical protein